MKTPRAAASAEAPFPAVLASLRGRKIAVVGDVILDRYLFGQAATLLSSDVWTMLGLGGAALAVVLAFWKEFKLLAFDPDFAASLGLPVRTFWGTVYQTVMEGMFSDPIYGGNRDKAGWKLIGFPGVVAVHRENVEKYRGKKYTAEILGIADLS